MGQNVTHQPFAALALPHLDAAFNLARWLMRDEADASDAVQEAYLRALRGFSGFEGGPMRPWLLAIVRNTCFSAMKSAARVRDMEHAGSDDVAEAADGSAWGDPVKAHQQSQQRRAIDRALAALPVDYREVLILREMEDMPYRDIAQVIDAPIGTVMSRLSRARLSMQALLREQDIGGADGP